MKTIGLRSVLPIFPFIIFTVLISVGRVSATGALDRPDFGLQISNLGVSDDEADTTYNYLMLGAEAGLNIPLYRPAEHMAIGLNPQARLWVDLLSGVSDQNSSIVGVTLPLMATFKFNTDAAEKGTKSNVGFSLGVGVQYSGVLFGADFTESITAGFISPAAMAEINFGSRRGSGLFKLRFSSQFGPVEANVAREDIFPPTMNLQSLHLIWTPGY